MVLVDANVMMYAAGAPHAYKQPSVRFLERVASGEIDAAIDAETLQEILHRYRAIGRWPDGRQVFDLSRHIFPTIIPVTAEILDAARRLLDVYPRMMARDALHAAVAITEKLDALYSYDRDFDGVAGVRRLEP